MAFNGGVEAAYFSIRGLDIVTLGFEQPDARAEKNARREEVLRRTTVANYLDRPNNFSLHYHQRLYSRRV